MTGKYLFSDTFTCPAKFQVVALVWSCCSAWEMLMNHVRIVPLNVVVAEDSQWDGKAGITARLSSPFCFWLA